MTSIVAHRGVHVRYPENSLAAFEEAHRFGVRWVECDVWPSADGVPVILHDQMLDRTTTGSGLVWQNPFASLRELRLRDAGGIVHDDSPLPALAELAAGGAGMLLVEIKPPDSAAFVAEVVRVMRERRPQGQWMIQSFDEANLFHAMKIAPSLPAALLVESQAALDRALESRWKNVHVRHDLLGGAAASELRGRGISIGAWTPNQDEQLRRVVEMRVDCIITDDVVRAAAHVHACKSR